MLLTAGKYEAAGIADGSALLQMSDFNSLIALSQKYKRPVFGLSDEQLEQTGVVLARTKASMNNFKKLYSEAADKVISLTENA